MDSFGRVTCARRRAPTSKLEQADVKTDFSAFKPRAQAPSWLPRTHGDQSRPQGFERAPRAWPQISERISVSQALRGNPQRAPAEISSGAFCI